MIIELSKPSKKEILGIDLLRFVCASMVMIFHLAFWHFWDENRSLAKMLGSSDISYLLGPFSYFGWIGVEVFFVISGFVIAYSAEQATAFSFFRSRFIRLMPGIWICSILSLPFAYFIKRQNISTIAILFAKSIVMFPHGPWIQGILWTLPVEITFYCVVFFLVYRNMFKYIGLTSAIIGTYSAIYWLVYGLLLLLPGQESSAQWVSDRSFSSYIQLSLIHYGCFFSIGVFLWLVFIKQQYDWYLLLTPFLLLGCLFEINSFNSIHVEITNIPQPALVPILLWLVSVGFIVVSIIYNERIWRRLQRINHNAEKFVKWLGQMTYPLYLLHLPVGLMVIYLMSLAHINPYVTWLAGGGTALTTAALVAIYVEPWMKARARDALNRSYDKIRLNVSRLSRKSA